MNWLPTHLFSKKCFSKNISWLLALSLVMCFTACTLFKPGLDGRTLHVTPNIKYTIQSYETYPAEAFSSQAEIIINSQDSQQTLLSNMDISQKGLSLVLLTPFGQNLLSIRDDGNKIISEGILVKQLPVDPAWLLALLQLATLKKQQVMQGLSTPPQTNVQLNERFVHPVSPSLLNHIRDITYKQQTEISIRCCEGNGYTVIELPKQKTQIKIRTITDTPSP